MKIETATTYFPRCTRWHLKLALAWLDPRDLTGLAAIRLLDVPPDTPAPNKQPLYLGKIIGGGYLRPQEERQATIVLFTRHLYFGLPRWAHFTPLATVQVALTLAHEVGHHLLATQGYIFSPAEGRRPPSAVRRERLADNYSYELLRRMSAKWYYRVSLRLCVRLSNFYYDYGLVTWENGEYERAAKYWACAYVLNPKNADAWQGYRQAISKLMTPTAT